MNRSHLACYRVEFYMQYNFSDYKNTMLNPKYTLNPNIHYNYSNINYIPELLVAYSVVVDGEFLLEWGKYKQYTAE